MFCILIRMNPFLKTQATVYTQLVYFNIHKVYLKRYEQPTKKYCTPSVDGFTSELFQTSNDRNNTNDT